MTGITETSGEAKEDEHFLIVFHDARVSCGFPFQGLDETEKRLDLNSFLQHPAATFMIRAGGDSLIERLIDTDTYIIYDRMIKLAHGDLAYVLINGEECIREICYRDEKLFLRPRNENYPEIEVTEEMELLIRGTVILSLTLQYKRTKSRQVQTDVGGKKRLTPAARRDK